MLAAVNIILAYMHHTSGAYGWTAVNLGAALVVLWSNGK